MAKTDIHIEISYSDFKQHQCKFEIAFPIYILIGVGELSDRESSIGQSIGLLLLAALACWYIAIMAHILRHALETYFTLALFLSITYIWIIFSFTSAIMPMETN